MSADMPRARRAVAIALLLATPLAGWLASRVVIDNRLERWVARDRVEEARYADFCATFGGDEFIVVAVSGKPTFAPETLRGTTAVLERLEVIPGVVRVQGVPAVYRDLFGGEDPEELEREMTSTPFYTGLLLSRDADVAAMLVQVAPAADPGSRRELVRAVRDAAAPLAREGLRVAFVGSPVLIVALDEMSARESATTLPLAVLGSLLVLAYLLRSPRAMAAAAVPAGVAVAVALGAVAAVGGSLNMLTAAMPALLWVLSLSYSVHIANRYRQLRQEHPPADAVRLAVAQTVRGVTFSAITTALGFLSLLVAAMPPVRELGALGGAGIAVAWLTSLTVTPLLLELLRVGAAPARHTAHAHRAARSLPARAPVLVIGASVAIFVAAAVSIPRIRLESNPLTFLADTHPVVQDYRFVGERVAGFYTAEAVLRLPTTWTDPTAWPVIEATAARIDGSPIVSRVVSPLDLLRKLNQWDAGMEPADYRLPDSRERAERLAAQLDPRGREVLATLVSASGCEVRLSALVNEMDERRFLALVDDTRAGLAALPPGWSGFVTGQVLRLARAQQDLVETQLSSVTLALVVIFAAVWIGLRSWRLTLVALPPNLVPMAVTFAAMAWLAIPLDAATVMVASVALGIAVDNTIHYLVWYSRFRRGGHDAAAATHAALAVVAPAITAASAASCTGFLALTISSFLPIRYYGELSTIMMATALACHLLLTTAILLAARPCVAPEGKDQA
jgi:predicted RND superfamily exporter protein